MPITVVDSTGVVIYIDRHCGPSLTHSGIVGTLFDSHFMDLFSTLFDSHFMDLFGAIPAASINTQGVTEFSQIITMTS